MYLTAEMLVFYLTTKLLLSYFDNRNVVNLYYAGTITVRPHT